MVRSFYDVNIRKKNNGTSELLSPCHILPNISLNEYPQICNHRKAEDIFQFIENIANENHSNYDCSVLYISSHGGEGFFCCEDFETDHLREEKCYDDVRNSYKAYSTKSTEIFEEETQSVDNIPKGYILFDTVIDLFAPMREFMSLEQMHEHYSDILIGYASLPGREAFIGLSGSAYTEILTDCLKNLSQRKESLGDVMIEVNVRMKTKTTGDQQFSTHISYLEKKLVMRSMYDRRNSKDKRDQLVQREVGMDKQTQIETYDQMQRLREKRLREKQIEDCQRKIQEVLERQKKKRNKLK
ncbi:unnamed protein product [Mytilus edulis]|uniref:Peptidase C14A caspase catalytic domain-containing protein n=1 Tax=Mytilus edulis TaxID=6550 RepID=A0A8S3U3T2_MYTED|nr:unnamed protein product [Mytilus edulis]